MMTWPLDSVWRPKAMTVTGIDPVLYEIFCAESQDHIVVIRSYLECCRKLGEECRVTEDLMRALHTLHGSARMAGAEPIAEIALDEIGDEDRAAMLHGRGLLAGRPVSEIQLRILRDQWGTPLAPLTTLEFDACCLSANEPGEIVVTSHHVLTGYLHGQGDEETKFKVDGNVWHRTGDAGYLDIQGRLWLLGRRAAKIVDARGTLYLFAVECAASHHPNVKRAALILQKGQRLLVVALDEKRQGLNELRGALAWADLDEIRVLNTIPVDKRHNAKVDYPALSKMLG